MKLSTDQVLMQCWVKIGLGGATRLTNSSVRSKVKVVGKCLVACGCYLCFALVSVEYIK